MNKLLWLRIGIAKKTCDGIALLGLSYHQVIDG